MDHDKLNEAVRDCIRYTLSAEKPLESFQQWCDKRAAEGWPKAELAIVRKTALRMLSEIYNVGEIEGE